ncbi:MAG: VOC family protein [Gemmatimonadota bacterium]|nr:MAG: VOC family protein [Gemmatimonadota bacterium]
MLPPVTATATGEHQPGKFVWRDLLTHDLPGVKQFYGDLFGWQFQDAGGEDSIYTVITHDGQPIGGIVYTARQGDVPNRSQWVSYLSVPDVDRAAAQVSDAGGEVFTPPRDYPDRGRLAVVSDPQGALLALVTASAGDPVDRDPAINEWMWTELWTDDVEAAASFYRELVGYEFQAIEIYEGSEYLLFQRDGTARAGVIAIPWEGVRPNWLAYVRVADPVAVAARVVSLGGSVFLEPDDEVRNGDVAIVVDPSGAALTVQRWPPRTEAGGDQQ